MNTMAGMLQWMHPAVRIVSFLVFGLFLALGNVEQFVISAALLFFLFYMFGIAAIRHAWPMMRRMRWFFLSIFVVYLWMTPGRALWSGDWLIWAPTYEGLVMGVWRVLLLVLIMLAAHLLLWLTSRDQLVAALYWLMSPLVGFGFSRERFVVRMALVFGTVGVVQEHLVRVMQAESLRRRDIAAYAAIAGALVREVVTQGEQEECLSIEIDVEDTPPYWQWLWPLLFCGVMLLAN